MRKQKKYGCLTTIIVFIGIFTILGIIVDKGIKDMEEHPEKYDDSIAMKYIDVTADEGKQIDEILIKCGIKEVSKFEHDELLDNAHKKGETGYRISADGIDNIILYLKKDKTVNKLRYNDYDLYSDKKHIATLQDYTVSIEEVNKYQNLCQEKVKEVLKSPSSAKFPNYTKWGWKQELNKLTVQGYVDSQNSFGAELRSKFQFIIDMKTDTIQSFIFDGNELIKK